ARDGEGRRFEQALGDRRQLHACRLRRRAGAVLCRQGRAAVAVISKCCRISRAAHATAVLCARAEGSRTVFQVFSQGIAVVSRMSEAKSEKTSAGCASLIRASVTGREESIPFLR